VRIDNGTAFPHKEGRGFSIELKALPVDGRALRFLLRGGSLANRSRRHPDI
jgi:hypothetical protein